jgi:hypothetical protein
VPYTLASWVTSGYRRCWPPLRDVVTRRVDRFDSLIVAAREMNPTEAAEFEGWEASR